LGFSAAGGSPNFERTPTALSFDGPDAEKLREGDWRDWDAIREWARNLAPKLTGAGQEG